MVEVTETLIDRLLAEQRELSAVARFSRWHEGHAAPAQERYYRNLLPASAPGPGQQYAFEVDLDKCSGCKGCVTACHNLNGLDDTETWRSVGLLITKRDAAPQRVEENFLQHITTACHHCVDPGCLNGCPVLAYDKDPLTGIVRHLDDQCIGCQYCVMKCPYDVPQYSPQRGIVRKCDMCSDRLGAGEAPACVQACPNEAIRITVVDQKEASLAFRNLTTPVVNPFLPGSPQPNITVPTTQYRSKRPLPVSVTPANERAPRPAPAHLPLVGLLVLSQFAVGTSVVTALAGSVHRSVNLFVALTMAAAMGTGTLHLGKPMRAWRGFLGWRTSWFSRELIVFGGFFSLAALNVLQPSQALNWLVALTGLAGVFCSSMIYIDTQRAFWSARRTLPMFFGTTALLGFAGYALFYTAWSAPAFHDHSTGKWVFSALLLAVAFKLGGELRRFNHPASGNPGLERSQRLIDRPLLPLFRARFASGMLGAFTVVWLSLSSCAAVSADAGLITGVTLLALLLLLAGELLERHTFFVAEAAPRMPGGIYS